MLPRSLSDLLTATFLVATASMESVRRVKPVLTCWRMHAFTAQHDQLVLQPALWANFYFTESSAVLDRHISRDGRDLLATQAGGQRLQQRSVESLERVSQ